VAEYCVLQESEELGRFWTLIINGGIVSPLDAAGTEDMKLGWYTGPDDLSYIGPNPPPEFALPPSEDTPEPVKKRGNRGFMGVVLHRH
jgi:hypothetical protein